MKSSHSAVSAAAEASEALAVERPLASAAEVNNRNVLRSIYGVAISCPVPEPSYLMKLMCLYCLSSRRRANAMVNSATFKTIWWRDADCFCHGLTCQVQLASI